VTHTDKQDNVEEQNSLEKETHNEIIDKKILRFQAQVNMFKSKLDKFKKLNTDTGSLEKFKPELVEILNLINEIINK
jgi:hypothetical protein